MKIFKRVKLFATGKKYVSTQCCSIQKVLPRAAKYCFLNLMTSL